MAKIDKNIYNLSLHEGCLVDDDLWILRVPGGWIYRCLENETSVFVPFNNEFQKAEAAEVKL